MATVTLGFTCNQAFEAAKSTERLIGFGVDPRRRPDLKADDDPKTK